MSNQVAEHTTTEKVVCYHCGNDCEEEVISGDDKDFCCTGCRSVYFLLKDNGLCDYYSSDETPGLVIKEVAKERFDYLDNEKIISDLVDFQNDNQLTITLSIPQIHCYSCLWLLEMLNKIHHGVSRAKVNYFKKELSVTLKKSETSLKELVIKLASLGYEPRMNLQKKDSNQSVNKRLLNQIGVAAFCFGNIMFMYFPEYLTSVDNIAPQLYRYFGYISLLLASVLILVSARDYFSSAIRSLTYKKINLDVPVALGIATIYISSAVEILTKSSLGYLDSLSGLIFFLLLGKLFQSKTFEQFNFDRDYKSYFPLSVLLLDDIGGQHTISVSDLQVGDRILVRNEEIIPEDGILQSSNASIDYSFVTGESLPEAIEKDAFVYAGGKIKGNAVEVIVSNVTSQSYLTQLWDHSSMTEETKIHSLSDKIGSWFTAIVLLIAFCSAGYWFFVDSSLSVKVFSSILIIACPCALALAIPITYGNALRVLGKRNFYLKKTSLVENLAEIDTIVFDKTGTLTYSSNSEVKQKGEFSKTVQEYLSSILANSIHPLSHQVLSFLNTSERHQVLEYEEVNGKGLSGKIAGLNIKLGSYTWVTGERQLIPSLLSEVHVSINDEYKGVFEIKNTYRSGLKSLFWSLKKLFSLEVLSGDNDREKERLQQQFGFTQLHFFQTPFLKKKHISSVKNTGRKVMMIGDGLNDAGALQVADVGVAITESSVGFTPASDVILQAKDLSALDKYLQFTKKSIYVVYACFGLSFLYNFVGLFFAVQGKLSPVISAVLMPISSVSVLLLSLGLLKFVERRVFTKSKKTGT